MQVDLVGIGEQVEDDFRANGPSFTVDAALCWTAFGFCAKRTRRQDRLVAIDRQEVEETARQLGNKVRFREAFEKSKKKKYCFFRSIDAHRYSLTFAGGDFEELWKE